MSMLSAQIDKLRKAAQTYRTLGGHEMEHTLLDAADTIDYLRNTCNDLQAENEKLRADATHWELGNCPSCKNVADLQEALDENARLRELVKNMHGWLVVNYEKSYVIPLNGLNDIERDMRELGIEMEP